MQQHVEQIPPVNESEQSSQKDANNEKVSFSSVVRCTKIFRKNPSDSEPVPFNSLLSKSQRKSCIDVSHISQMRISSDEVICNQEQSLNLTQSITCPICLLLLQVPYYECQGCSNGFCTLCLESWWKKYPQSCAFKCSNVEFKQIKRSNTYNAVVSMLKVKCQYCHAQKSVADISSHILNACDSVPELCRFCEAKMTRKQLDQHEQSVCQRRPWRCEYCLVCYSFCDRVSHDEVCEQKPLPCGNEGCEVTMPRKAKSQHSKQCQYNRIGCQWCSCTMLEKQYRQHRDNCQKRIYNCQWCEQQFQLQEFREHESTCQVRKQACQLCCEMVLVSTMKQHKIECMFDNLVQMKSKSQSLEQQNRRLGEKVILLQGLLEETIANREANTMKVVSEMRQKDRRVIEKDLLRLDNSIKSVQKLRKEQFSSHLRMPHLIQSWCPVCKEMEKKFKNMLEPLFEQRKQVLDRLEEFERFSFTPR